MNTFEHGRLKVYFNPTTLLRYAFNPIDTLRYNFKHGGLRCVFLKTNIGNRVFNFNLMKMYFSILDFANRNSWFTDFKIASFDKFRRNCVFNPISLLRFVFNPIITVRYAFEYSHLQLVFLKTVFAFCVFQKAKSKNAVLQSLNQKMQFANFIFKTAHCGDLYSKSILSDSIGIKTILSNILGLKWGVWSSVFKIAICNHLFSKLHLNSSHFKKSSFRHPVSENAKKLIRFEKRNFRHSKSENAENMIGIRKHDSDQSVFRNISVSHESIPTNMIGIKTYPSDSIEIKT